jgi:predicted GNAT superfamily acetyltransferase
MTSAAISQRILIRDLESFEDLLQVKAVEKEVWGMADEDSLPMTLAVALQAAGSIFLGALDGPKLVGFAFGFLAREQGQPAIHSHMLAVLGPYRQHDVGRRLKLAQRERALAMGMGEMTWTFDPLQSRNAHFNLAKLGVVSHCYKIDFYGPETSSLLHRNGTDRLWVRWLLDSRRVQARIAGKDARAEAMDALRLLSPLVTFNGDGRPVRADLQESLARQRVSIEIPGDILAVEAADMGLAREWREATRWAFTNAIEAGFVVTDFCRTIRGQQGPGAYLLQKERIDELASDG